MTDEASVAAGVEPEAAPPQPEEHVTFVYDGHPVSLLGHGPIEAGEITVTPELAAGLIHRPDFRRVPKKRSK